MAHTRSQFKNDINSKIQGRIGMVIDIDRGVNLSALSVIADIDTLSAKRSARLIPSVFPGIDEYASPSDMSERKIIGIPSQVHKIDGGFNLTTPEEFRNKRNLRDIAVEYKNGQKNVLIHGDAVNSQDIQISPLDSTDGWVAFGDTENISKDTGEYTQGIASVSFDITDAGGVTAGIQKDDIDSFDITDYKNANGAMFIDAFIQSVVGLTNIILRIGSSSSDYYNITVTAQNDGTALVSGWNTLRFDLQNLVAVGTPNDIDMSYVALYMTKLGSKISEQSYRFDNLTLKRGEIRNISYYTSYPWKNSVGAYISESTDDQDTLIFSDEEYTNIVLPKGISDIAYEINDIALGDRWLSVYQKGVALYKKEHPSESLLTITSYHRF